MSLYHINIMVFTYDVIVLLSTVPEKMSAATGVEVENPTLTPPPSASQPWLPTTVKLVNQNGQSVPITELDDKQIIGVSPYN